MSSRAGLLCLLGLPLAVACEPSSATDTDARAAEGDTGQRAPAVVPSSARAELRQTGQLRLIVELAPPNLPMLRAGQTPTDQLRVRTRRKALLQEEVQSMMGALPTGVTLSRSFGQLPLATVDLTDEDALDALARDPRVVALHIDERMETSLDESLGLINQPDAEADGFTGAGTAVAVLDTGLDYTHRDFGSCTDVGVPSSCQVVENLDIAPEDGELDDNGHGTNVAAIVGGVAPGTDLIGLDVFRSDGYAYTSDVVSAIDWVVDNASDYNIVALNMSLGGGRYTDTCDYSAFELAIAIAADAGIASAVATGNDGWSDSIASPACAPSAIKVGAVYSQAYSGISWSTCSDTNIQADDVTCFSNSADFVDLLAPGAIITAGGYRMGGTSQATPHVAGALAVLAEAYPTDGPEEWLERLQDTGSTVVDTRNGLSFPRIDVGEAVVDAATGEPPTVSLTLNDGDTVSDSRVLTASVLATDGSSPVTQMCLANADDGLPSSCTDWRTLSSSVSWQSSAGQGDKTVAVWVRDSAGQVSEPATAGILLDTLPPTTGSLSATRTDGGASLQWTEGIDSGSGVDHYTLVYSDGSVAPSSCSVGELAYEGSDLSTFVSGLAEDTATSFRLCVTDAAGNISDGTTSTLSGGAPEAGSITINGGAAFTNSQQVELTLAAEGAAEMCISNTPRCADDLWRSYESTVGWTLPNVDGERTISARFRYADGSESDATTATIIIDRQAPNDGTVHAWVRPMDGRLQVTWRNFSDELSGVASYRLQSWVFGPTPATCDEDAPAVSGSMSRAVVDAAPGLVSKKVAICAVDEAGNMGAPVQAVVRTF